MKISRLARVPSFSAMVCAALVIPAFSALMAANVASEESVSHPKEAPVAVLKTQDFESGEKAMSDVSAESLEAFLQDLNQRKDWDYALHNGKPGPDAAYLFKWVVRTIGELERRGYYLDAAQQLHRPGTVVPVR